MVLIHHMPGWDEWIIEATRKLAHHGFATIAPHLYFREGPGSPDDVGARVRAAGGVADDQVVGDAKGAAAYLRAQPQRQRQGRRDRLLLRRPPRLPDRLPRRRSFNALVDCWGGNVVVDDPKALNAKRPVAPIDLADKHQVPASSACSATTTRTRTPIRSTAPRRC